MLKETVHFLVLKPPPIHLNHLVCVTCWIAACVFAISLKCINLRLESNTLS